MKKINFVKKNLPYRSIRHINDNAVKIFLEKIVNKKILTKIHNQKALNKRFLNNYIRWISSSNLNKFLGLKKFKYKVFSQGTTQSFDQFYLKYNKKRFRVFKGEYAYHLLSFRNHNLKWAFLDNLKLDSNDAIIVSLPFSDSGFIHENLNEVLKLASKKKIPVLIDCCYLGACKNINFNFNKSAIETIVFSLSKTFPVSRYRIGMRIQKVDDDDPMYVYHKENYVNLLSCYIGNKLIQNFKFDYFYKKYYRKQMFLCKKMNIKPSNVVNLALGGKDFKMYNRGGRHNRLCISQLLENKKK